MDARRIDALDRSCLRTLLGIKWHHLVCNEEVRRITKQPNLTAIIQSHCLSIFGHIARIDDNADAKMILTAPPPKNWNRPPGHPHITWLNTIQRDLRTYNLTLNEAVDLAQSHPAEADVYVLRYALLVVHSRKPEKKKIFYWNRIFGDKWHKFLQAASPCKSTLEKTEINS